jgi:GntR family transcriptional regulator, galactonate operon transcriptional repressor
VAAGRNLGEPIVRTGLQEQLVRRLGLRIVRGDVEPGGALPPEDTLAADFAVSRNVVREAIRALAAKGLVKGRPRTGTQIRPRNQWNLLDEDVLEWQYEAGHDPDFLRNVCEVRMAVEPLAAGLAAARADERQIAELEAAYRRMENEVDDDEEIFIDADLGFHNAVLAASGNELLEQVGRTFKFALRASRQVTVLVPNSRSEALPLHRRVLEAVREGDASAAEDAMRALLERAAEDIESWLAGDGPAG